MSKSRDTMYVVDDLISSLLGSATAVGGTSTTTTVTTTTNTTTNNELPQQQIKPPIANNSSRPLPTPAASMPIVARRLGSVAASSVPPSTPPRSSPRVGAALSSSTTSLSDTSMTPTATITEESPYQKIPNSLFLEASAAVDSRTSTPIVYGTLAPNSTTTTIADDNIYTGAEEEDSTAVAAGAAVDQYQKLPVRYSESTSAVEVINNNNNFVPLPPNALPIVTRSAFTRRVGTLKRVDTTPKVNQTSSSMESNNNGNNVSIASLSNEPSTAPQLPPVLSPPPIARPPPRKDTV